MSRRYLKCNNFITVAAQASKLSIGDYLTFSYEGKDYTIFRTRTNYFLKHDKYGFIECFTLGRNSLIKYISANRIHVAINSIVIREVHDS